MSYGVANLDLLRVLYSAYDITYFARIQFVARYHVHLQHPHLVGVIFHSCVEELHFVALVNRAINYLEIGNYATERVEHRVEYQGL